MKTSTTPWVMESTPKQLSGMITDFLMKIDDLQQEAADAGKDKIAYELSEGYSEMERWLSKIQSHSPITVANRNAIRLSMKHYLKLAALIS